MVSQSVDLATHLASNLSKYSSPTLVPASHLQEGQQVIYNGAVFKVRRVVPAFTRSHACHVHLVPPNWHRLNGVSGQLADRDESAVLVRVACSTLKPFQVVA